ncbi:MAG: sigma-70 family RNA polymerase sigma factor [Lachnospiraceae bacterium]|nr:sigma-70 family RNA polymerase sigma factor [Lachnospiraceae bacterium]
MKNRKKTDAWEESARKKLEEIYRVHGALMLQVAMGILKQTQDAEDALQNSIISMARHMDAVGDVSDYKTVSYVCTVVKHAAIDIYRKRNRGQLSYEELLEGQQDQCDVEELVCGEEGVGRIVEAISNLEVVHQEVLSLFYLNELSPREIADVLQRPYNTVKSQIHRGRKILQQSLQMGGVI